MGFFEISARDGAARAGEIRTAHGKVKTPAFIPLASKATIKSMLASEVAGLGYEMVLGNTYHLFLSPGADEVRARGGLHTFMDWDGALITDSGGFQIFSMGHGRVADEIKGRSRLAGGGGGEGAILAIEEDGVRFRSYLDGAERFMGPETSMEAQVALGSDIALVLDECTPYNAGRDYTARSMERTHRWLDRCLDWHRRNGPQSQAVFGIVQGGPYEDLRRESADRVATAGVEGIAIGGSLGKEKSEMYGVVAWSLQSLPQLLPKHLLGIGEVDDLLAGVALGIDIFDCAMPTRLARHGTALVPNPERRWRLDLGKAGRRDLDRPIAEGCSCRACRRHTCAYLHYLVRAHEITAIRLLTEHNLNFIACLMEGVRASIGAGRFSAYASGIRGGAAPWS